MKYISPLIYFIFAACVAVVTIFTVILVERTTGLHVFLRMGDVDFVVALFVWGGIIFFFGNKILFHIARIEVPTFADHFRQCALLYPLLVIFGIAVIRLVYNFLTIENYNVGMGSAYPFLIAGVSFMGIIMNGIAIFLRRTRAHSSQDPKK